MKQRLERALEVAMSRLQLDKMAFGQYDLKGNSMSVADALAEIDTILHPVEVIEEEVVRYVVIDANGVERWYGHDAKPGILEGEQIVEMRGTIRREKKVVERSVTIPAQISSKGITFNNPAVSKPEWSNHPECHGKRGTLTFEWTE